MPFAVAIKALAVWAIILALAVLNGALRETVLTPLLGSEAGLIFSGLLLSSLIFAISYLCLPWLGARNWTQFVFVGLCWLVCTLAFEFSFGLLRGLTIAEISKAYTFEGGNIWPVVLVVTTVAPWAAARLRGLL